MAIDYTNKLIENDYDTMIPNYVKDIIENKINNGILTKIYRNKSNNNLIIEYVDEFDNTKHIEYDKDKFTISFDDNVNLIEEIYESKHGKYSLTKKIYFYPNSNNSITRVYNTIDGNFKYILRIDNEKYNMQINYFYNKIEVDSLKEINKLIVNDFHKSYHDPAYSDIYSKYADDIMKIVFDGNLHFDSLYEIYEHLNKYLVLNKAGLRLDKDDSNLFVSRNYVYNYNEYFIKDGIKYHIYKKNIQSNEPVFYVEEVIDKEIGNIEDTKEFIKKIGRK